MALSLWRMLVCAGSLAAAVVAQENVSRPVAGTPAEVTVTAPTKFELIANGKAAGSIGLRPGDKLEVVERTGAQLVVRYRNLSGRVLLAHTDFPREEAAASVSSTSIPVSPAAAAVGSASAPGSAPAPAGPTPAASVSPSIPAVGPAVAAATPPAATRPAPPAPPLSAAPYVPTAPIERALAGKLVRLENNALRPAAPAQLEGVKFFGLYFSAGWCGPCRAFTPSLVDAYGKIRSMYPEFEVIHVNRDKSPADMFNYVRDERMPWLSVSWSATAQLRDITRYAGSGIPCLVLVDAEGKVLSDSYRWTRYVGPEAVVDDTWKILREYRKTHPRPKKA